MLYFILMLSLLLETSVSNLVSRNSIFLPLFLVTSLVVIYPYMESKKSNFIISTIIFGVLYDFSFSNTLFINTLSFSILAIIIINGYKLINYRLCSSIILNIIVLIMFKLISYLLLNITTNADFNFIILLKNIFNSLLLNVLYGIALFYILKLISRRFNIKKKN